MTKIIRPSVFLLALVVVTACAEPDRFQRASGGGETTGDRDETSGSGDAPEVDQDELLDQARGYAQGLTLLTPEPELSETHSDAASVRVWGSASALDKFLSIDPDDPTQQITFEEGTMLVKEHLDAGGQVSGLTVMVKGPEGYDPDARDWFWARLRGDEVTHAGRVQWCIDCHEAALNTDLVVGFGKSP